jgi:hypothetical protein
MGSGSEKNSFGSTTLHLWAVCVIDLCEEIFDCVYVKGRVEEEAVDGAELL